MDNDMQRLIDQLAIQQVLARYARGADRGDTELLTGVYWEDSIDNHGPMVGNGYEYAKGMAERLPTIYHATFHHLGQTCFLKMEPTRVACETYFMSAKRNVDVSQPGHMTYGRYYDLFEKRNGEWKIFRRDVIFDICQPMSPETAFVPGQTLGRRDRQDPSYRPPGSNS